MKDYAYFMVTVNPQKLLLQLNADLVNAVYRKIMQIRGLEQKDLIPDIGDLLLRAEAKDTYIKFKDEAEKAAYKGATYNLVDGKYVKVESGPKGEYRMSSRTELSLNLRLSDGLFMCIDIRRRA